MVKWASDLFHLTTFQQFSSKIPENRNVFERASFMAYLMLANIAELIKKDLAHQRMERRYKGWTYAQKAAKVQADYRAMLPDLKRGQRLSSVKKETHQFAATVSKPHHRLDTRFLNKALIDAEQCFVDVEANMSFGDLTRFLRKAGYRVPLVPEFLDITVGGAFVGVAIESSAHKFGMFHEHVLQAEVLMADGELRTMSLKEYQEWFRALPNSNGTLGRIMRLRVPLIPLKSMHPDQLCHPFLDEERREAYLAAPEPEWLTRNRFRKPTGKRHATEHVHYRYEHFDSVEENLERFWQAAELKEPGGELKKSEAKSREPEGEPKELGVEPKKAEADLDTGMAGESKLKQPDFVESVLLDADHAVLITGEIVESADDVPASVPRHEYLTRDVFYKHVIDKKITENCVPLESSDKRWMQSVFWNTQGKGPLTRLLNNPMFRRIFGRYMGPGFVAMLGEAYAMWKAFITPMPTKPPVKKEHMVQDIGIPKDKVPEFAKWYKETIGLYPIWLCPVKASDRRFPNMDPKTELFYLDWGMFTGEGMPLHESGDPWYYNKLIEAKLIELGGIKALYSDNHFSEAQFAELYNTEHYLKIKREMDPEGVFPTVFQKMVEAQKESADNQKPQHKPLPFSFDAFMLWMQCTGVAMVSGAIAAYVLARPKFEMVALGLAVGMATRQSSYFFSRVLPVGDGKENMFARGVSGWLGAGILTSALLLARRSGWSGSAVTAALLAVSATELVKDRVVAHRPRIVP